MAYTKAYIKKAFIKHYLELDCTGMYHTTRDQKLGAVLKMVDILFK